ncbi:MAG: DJ-1/PfpI family protein [Clostridia bacterium]|nr:DJ-1/PfpI family protein [Clostridia bacterium]
MILLLLADGFEETEALVPLDLLRRGKCDVKTVGITGKTVCGAHGIPVTADLVPNDVRGKIDALILPGGMPGTTNLDASPDVDRLIEKTLSDGGRLAAICAAPLILGRRGLLTGKRAVCFPGFESELTGAVKTNARVVTDGNVTTAVGMGAAYEFGLALLSLLAGKQTAEQVRVSSLIPPTIAIPD